ncbi:MAG: phenylalanine--tRNA ligase subunit alpha [Euryarchaeota archaeon]|nr:phenylalanine--tRNA ligase subunit alpha [Euryarchaeota archaeon]MDE1836107.1 phenylalanine--tRNA ligase subunit alpha [Euryarchaeota archaeon]MDE1879397.1 phenylalanine--tRNA ligase subunit alpha [Euryarchaeota archaeon]MDE2044085.1 phenylalanine--tRNA ligase subunit alpha [Thermoplasmata archaeon]
MAAPEPGSPSVGDLTLTLSPPEVRLLKVLKSSPSGKAVPEEEVAQRSELSPDATRGGLERLRSKRLTVLEERSEERWTLTSLGNSVVKDGLPERRVLTVLAAKGPLAPSEIPDAALPVAIRPEEVTIAIGPLRRQGRIVMGEKLSVVIEYLGNALELEGALQTLAAGGTVSEDKVLKELARRGVLSRSPERHRAWKLSPEGLALPLEETSTSLGAITPSLLKSRAWAKGSFRPYDVRAQVPHLGGSRRHLYREWLRQVEEVLVGLGFEEFRGPLVELEFYNNDLLFMPQEHPARSMHDMFFVEGVEGHGLPPRLLRSVAAVHEGRALPRQGAPLSSGWQTPYGEEVARRVVLRSQTTAATMRYLASHPKPPFRMYSLDAVFRYDQLDATHLIQFDQCEGAVGKSGLTFRHLLGLLTQFAKALGIPEVKFQPTYFPFTEPSVQGFVRHPTLGWVEMMPGGMFRPEVLRPLGIKVPVAAWGIGIGRLAMVALGLSDIRDLFMDDLPRLSKARV